MARAPWPVAVAFGVALAVVIALAGPLLLFNPGFTSALQSRHEVTATFGTSQVAIDRVTGEILEDLYLGGPFDAALTEGEPLLDARERSHMSDVSRLVQLLAATTVVAGVVAVAAGIALRREPRRLGRLMLTAAAGVGAVAIVLAAVFAVAFEQAFLAFHAIFFRPGTFLFAPGSNLIGLFPQGFWFDASLAAGTAIVITALVVTVGGFLRMRDAASAEAGAGAGLRPDARNYQERPH